MIIYNKNSNKRLRTSFRMSLKKYMMKNQKNKANNYKNKRKR